MPEYTLTIQGKKHRIRSQQAMSDSDLQDAAEQIVHASAPAVKPVVTSQPSTMKPPKLFRTPEEAKRQVQQQTIRAAESAGRGDLTYSQGEPQTLTGKSKLKSSRSQITAQKPEGVNIRAGKAIQKAGETIAAPFKKVDEMAARAILESGGGTVWAQERYKEAQRKNPGAKPFLQERTFHQALDPLAAEALQRDETLAGGLARFGMNALTPGNALPVGAIARGGQGASRFLSGAFGVPAAVGGVGQVMSGENPGQILEGALNTLLGAVGTKQALTKTPKAVRPTSGQGASVRVTQKGKAVPPAEVPPVALTKAAQTPKVIPPKKPLPVLLAGEGQKGVENVSITGIPIDVGIDRTAPIPETSAVSGRTVQPEVSQARQTESFMPENAITTAREQLKRGAKLLEKKSGWNAMGYAKDAESTGARNQQEEIHNLGVSMYSLANDLEKHGRKKEASEALVLSEQLRAMRQHPTPPTPEPSPAPLPAETAPPVREGIAPGSPESAQTEPGRVISPVESVPIGENNVRKVSATETTGTNPLSIGTIEPAGSLGQNQPALTGPKNATTETERANRGQSPVERQAYTTIPEAYETGRQAVEGGKTEPRVLAKEVSDKPRPLNAEEVGALAYDRARIIKDYDAATAEIASLVGTENASRIPQLQTKREQLLEDLDTNDTALVKGGREQSAAFAARKMMVGSDYSFAGVQQRAKTAAERPLNQAEAAKFEALTAQLKEKETALAAAESALKEAQAQKPATKQNKAAQGVPEGASVKEKLIQKLSADEQQKLSDAVGRFRQKASRTSAGLPGAQFVDALPELVEIGVLYTKAVGRSFSDWKTAIREEVGDMSDAQAEMLYAHVKESMRKERGQPQQLATPESFADRLAQKLGREGSVEFLNAIDDGEQTILSKLIAGDALTPVEKKTVQDAWAQNSTTRATKQESGAAKAVSDIIKETAKERARQRLAQARANMTPEKREAQQTKRLGGQIADLQQRISQGNFSLPKRPASPEPSQNVKQLQAQRDLLKAKINSEVAKMKPMTPGRVAAEIASAPRSLITSFDLSAPLRQGSVLSLANPRLAVKNIGPMLRAFMKEEAAQIVENDIRQRPNAQNYESSGLYLAPLDETASLSKREEAFMSSFAERVPGVRASGRAYVTYLNKLRADTFDMFASSLPNATTAELTAVADFINTATGRGKLGASGERAATLLNNTFFSPRYLTSRLQMITGEPLYRGSARTRGLVARTYLQYAGAVAGIILLAKQGGAEVETDPRHTDFLKLKSGNTVVDVLAGMQQAGTYLSRMATGESVSAAGNKSDLTKPGFKGASRLTVTQDFLRGKLAPVPGSAVNLMAGSNIVGEPSNLLTEGARLTIPMSWPDVYKAAQEEGIPAGSAVFLMSLFGLGVQYRSKSDRPKKASKSSGKTTSPPNPAKQMQRDLRRLRPRVGGLMSTTIY
jgi:hypothetical protein